ncbi:Ig-like domain-containing protein [Psychrobacter sp. WY6]|nr:Ig-like domain-containing protein [Psychrobacter sp. WY6]
MAEEVTATGNVLDNDTDIDSSTLNVSAASVDVDGSGTQVAITLGSATTISANGSAIGVLTLNSDGSYSFVPAADFNGTVPTVDYTVTDNDGGTASSTLDIVITPVNDAPIAVNDSYTVNEDESIALNPLKGDSDIDGDTLSITSINGTALTGAAQVISVPNGSVSIDSNGDISFTPEANFNGQVEFDYTISDGKGGTDTATETITVTAVNDAPIAKPDSNRVAEEVTATGNVLDNDTDIDSSTLNVSAASVDVDGSGTQVAITLGSATTISANGSAIGVLTLNSDGSYSFVPAADFNGTVPTVDYTVTDNDGGTASSTLDIVITPVNDAPIAVNDSYTVNEDESIALNPLKGDSDIDGDTLSIININGTALTPGVAQSITVDNGVVKIDINGAITFTPEANFNGQVEFDYTISDGKGGTDTATETITVTAVNDAPIAKPDSNRVAEEVTATGNVLDNDTDIDSSTLNVSAASVDVDGSGTQVAITLGSATTISANGSAIGVLTLNSDGSYSFVPAADFNGTVPTVDYTVTDNDGGTASSTLDIVITPVNDAPIAVNDSYTVNEDESIALNPLKGDSDIDGDTLSITSINGTALTGAAQVISVPNGSVSIDSNGGISFTPEANFNGQVEFDYTISDGKGGTDTATETITVTAVNDAPIAKPDSNRVAEEVTATGNVLDNDTDIDSSTLNVSAASVDVDGSGTQVAITLGSATTISANGSAIGVLTLNSDGSYSFVPAADFNGTVPTVDYTVTDNDGGTASSTLDIVITPVNDAPIAVNDSYTVAEDGSVILTPLKGDSDIDGDTLSITSINGTALTGAAQVISVPNGSVSIDSNGGISFTPEANFNGQVEFDYTISDGKGGTDTATETITVTAVNDAPIAKPDSNRVAEEVTATGNVLDNDTDIDSSTLNVSAASVDVDGSGTQVAITLGSATTISANGSAIGVLTLNSDGSYSFVPAADFNGTVPTVDYTVTDNDGGTASSTLDIVITPVNDAPIAVNDSYTVNEDESIALNPLKGDSDIDGDTLSITSINGTALTGAAQVISVPNGSVSMDSNGGISFTPEANFNGQVEFDYTISDGKGGTDTATETITVTAVNDAPIAVNDSYTVAEDGSVILTPLKGDSDIDGDTLSITSINGTALTGAAQVISVPNGSVSIDSNGGISFTPEANFNGQVEFDYTISDGKGGTDTATETITVTAVNDAPIAKPDSNRVAEEVTATGNVLDNDTDIDSSTLNVSAASVDVDGSGTQVAITLGSATTISANGSAIGVLTLNSDGSYSFVPAADFNGTVPTVDYTVTDNDGGTASSTLDIVITPVNDAPIAVNDSYTVNEDESIALNPLKGDSDIDGDTLSIININGTALTQGSRKALP